MKHLARVLSFGGLVAVLLAFASADVVAQKKKDKDKDKDRNKYPAAADADYKAIQKQKELSGKLVSMDGSNVSLRVEYPHWEANPKYRPAAGSNPNSVAGQQAQLYRTYNDIMRQQQQAALAKNPQELQRAMQRINQDMARLQQEIARVNQQIYKTGAKVDPNNQPFIVITQTRDFDLALEPKVVFRKLVLPFEYDDTGKPKTYSEKEKADLRGDDRSKPGYAAKLEDFAPGQEVKLTLVAPKKKEGDDDKDKDKDKDEVQRPTVRMVVMTKDNPDATTISGGASDDKKKKKN